MNVIKATIKVLALGMIFCSMSCSSSGKDGQKTTVNKPSSAIPEKRLFPLDSAVNPCEDFHKYVCNDVEKSFQLREDRSSHTFSFNDSSERILDRKKDFFEVIGSEKNLSARSEQLKDYYQACMNEKNSIKEEKALVQDLKHTIAQIKTSDEFLKLNVDNMTNEKWSFLWYTILPNIDNPKIYDTAFGPDWMFLPEHSYYDNADLIKDYQQLIADFLDTLYPEEKKAEHLARAMAVIDLEKRFKDTYPKPAEFRKRYTEAKYIKRADYLKNTSNYHWNSFFEKNIPETAKIRDFIPESTEFVQKELVKPENLNVLKDMYIFRNARTFMDDAYPELYKKRMAFSHKHLGGPPTRPDRHERCTSAVMGSFGLELDQVMVEKMFPNFPKEKMVEVANKIRASILEGIKGNKWLSANGKKEAYKKISTAKLQIIQPMTDKEWDFKPIQKYSNTHPYENSKKLATLAHQESFRELKEGVNQEAWGMGPLTVNAYYDPTANKFVLPIGILQYPFFVAEGDVTENLGAVGAVVAHELGHAIDDQGSKFDSSGKLRQWMTKTDVERFKGRGKKLIDQFNKIGHNGELTQGENVADLVGLTFAYHAAFPKNKGAAEDKKKFFVAYARLWCDVTRDKAIEMQLKTDPHSLGYARINEQVKHQPGFQEVYACKKGDKLFLDKKEQITIW